MRAILLAALAASCAPPPGPTLPLPPDLDRIEARLLHAREVVARWEAVRRQVEGMETAMEARQPEAPVLAEVTR